MAQYQAHFLNTGEWWIAWTDDVPGALTQGETLEEARDNLKEAIAMMLEPVGASWFNSKLHDRPLDTRPEAT